MSRAAFQSACAPRKPHAKAASAKDGACRVGDSESQVVPFYLDDCVDDNEEIRRRRYSSSYSSCQDEDERGGGRRRGAQRPSPGASDWEKASSQEPSSASLAEFEDDGSGEEEDVRGVGGVGLVSSKAVNEEPESPRKARRKSQQSDDDEGSSSDNDQEEEEEGGGEDSKPKLAVHTPAALLPSDVDLSSISKLSVFPGSEGEALVQGHVVRVKALLGGPQYLLFLHGQLVLMAHKQLQNRTSNYHVFDMTRAVAGARRLSKKSGNYVGKLRATFSRRKCVLVSSRRRRTELGAMAFAPAASSSEPRRLTVVLPPLSSARREVEGLTVGDSSDSFSVLLDLLAAATDDKAGSGDSNSKCSHSARSSAGEAAARHSPIPVDALQVFESKRPVFENGYYRLNFNGRVSVPSVKNFQLVARPRGAAPTAGGPAEVDSAPVVLQFGKVDDQKFHLDFRAPVTPIQAFAIALAQFNY